MNSNKKTIIAGNWKMSAVYLLKSHFSYVQHKQLQDYYNFYPAFLYRFSYDFSFSQVK